MRQSRGRRLVSGARSERRLGRSTRGLAGWRSFARAYEHAAAGTVRATAVLTSLLALTLGVSGASCGQSLNSDLDRLGTVDLTINAQKFRLWVADENSERERGLMKVTSGQMSRLSDGTERGMVFVFDRESVLYFWMKDTIIPLDIAYLDSQGVVTAIHTMAALDTRVGQYSSGRGARYAIEVNADTFGRLGLKAGDRVEMPDSILKR